MKTLFICDEFTLDLTGKELVWTEVNSWFSDDFILSSTFPFAIDFDENDYFLRFKNYNDTDLQTKFEGHLQRADGKLTPAYLEIEEAVDKLSGVIRDGIELFPSWDVPINQFDLGVVDVPDMVAHAESVVTKVYPQTTYNFPMIECHELYKDSPHFAEHFRGFYNFRTPSGFMRNIEATETNVAANNNIVYPMPYWLHILKTGIEMGDHTLHGDILEDEHFKRACMPINKIEFFNERPESRIVEIGYIDINEDLSGGGVIYYTHEEILSANTRYKISGEILSKNTVINISVGGSVIYNVYSRKRGHKLELIIEPGEEVTLRYVLARIGLFAPGYNDVFEGLIVPQEIYDNDGNLISHVANFNKVDLASQLPEITFGEFVKIFKSMKNYDFELRPGKQIWMNRIEDQMGHDNAIDLRKYERKNPIRRYEEKGSFLLRYENNNEDFPSTETFVTLDEVITGFQLEEKEDTKTISINCSVLPVVPNGLFGGEHGPHITAKIIDSDTSRPGLVLFDGLKDGMNYTSPVDELETPFLVEKYHRKFIYFYIKHIRFEFLLQGEFNEFMHLHKTSKIFIYNNHHIIEELHRTKNSSTEFIEVKSRTF